MAVAADSVIGECPVWSADLRALLWIDVVAPGRLFVFTPSLGTLRTWPLPAFATGLALGERGLVLVSGLADLMEVDPTNGNVATIASLLPAEPSLRVNEGRCGPDGRLWYGVMKNNFADVASDHSVGEYGGLWSLDADFTRRRRWPAAMGCPNALAWNHDGSRMYFADSVDGGLYAASFDLDSGALTNIRPFARISGRGVPDGAAVDEAGYVWNARWDGRCVLRFTPEGAVDCVVDVPASRPTSCTFGGPDLRTLFITTSSFGVSPALEPFAGSLFAVRAPVPGVAAPHFVRRCAT